MIPNLWPYIAIILICAVTLLLSIDNILMNKKIKKLQKDVEELKNNKNK